MIPGIGNWLTKREQLTPDREAVVDGDRRFTYGDLNRRVNRLCQVLQSMNLSFGDRLAILSYNRVAYLEVLMSAAMLGLVVVPLNWRLTAPELAYMVKDSEASGLIWDAELRSLARELLVQVRIPQELCIGADHGGRVLDYETALKEAGDHVPAPDQSPDGDTPHIIMYTSGTTGQPKGAVLSQGASFWNALNLGLALGMTAEDRSLSVLPMFHIGGIGLFSLPTLYFGGTVVIQRTFEPVQTLHLLETERITLFFGVTAIFLFLVQHADFRPQAFDHARVIMSGGAPLPASLVQEYHDRGLILQQGFGMSEAAPSIATLDKSLALQKAGSVGRALFHMEARIVDDAMQPLEADQVGELVLRGPNLMQGYWNRTRATQEAFADGWFHTGDMARMDSDGDLYIVDRKKDMFISGGENVYPTEVENRIYELTEVAEVAVVGIPHERWGEVGLAVMAAKEGAELTEAIVRNHLKTCLATYKIPKRIVFVTALPRNAAGKVIKAALQRQYGE